MGKSTLMRALAQPKNVEKYTSAVGRPALAIYVDCNGMLELSGQGFYELILRAIQNNTTDAALLAELAELYQRVVEPDSQFMVPLSFNRALTTLIEGHQQDVILLFDEFDEVFDALDGRVFLNLRHLKDKYPRNLIYVTATVRRLGEQRMDDQTAEFVELTAPYTIIVTPLLRAQADQLSQGLAEYVGVGEPLTEKELDFLWRQAGGHPRLLRATVTQFAELYHTTEAGDAWVDEIENVLERFHHDNIIRNEIARLWLQVGPEERRALTAVALNTAETVTPRMLAQLVKWGVLTEEHRIFSALLEDFTQRQARVQQELPRGVWVNVDAGEVWVDGVAAPDLTELEFKLMALLFERVNKVTDKYQIVETVWGVEYIDDVDDSRIEKLVSRLRAKIEPDTSNPRYILTVRGRGYKLVSPEV
jgi:hypothetical protein